MSETPSDLPEQARPKIRFGSALAWGGLLIFLAIFALGLLRTQKNTIAIGERIPNFSLTTFDGKQVNLIDQRGKIVVLNFWSSWCKPCEQEAGDLEAAWQAFHSREDVIFWGINYVDTEKEALQYLDKFHISYPNGADIGTRISQIFRIHGVPETYFIDREGKLVRVQIGPFQSTEQIKNIIEPLLAQ